MMRKHNLDRAPNFLEERLIARKAWPGRRGLGLESERSWCLLAVASGQRAKRKTQTWPLDTWGEGRALGWDREALG